MIQKQITIYQQLQTLLHQLILRVYACTGKLIDRKIATSITGQHSIKLTVDSFPVQLAYGRLERASIKVKGAGLSADYYVFDRKAFQVIIYARSVVIKDLWDTGSIKGFGVPVAARFFFLPRLLSPAMNYFMDKVCSVGNVYYFPPETNSSTGYTYPEVFHFILRLPAVEQTLLKMANLIEHKNYLYQYVHDFYETTFTGITWAGELVDHRMMMVEFKVSISGLYGLVQYLVKHQLVCRGQYNQLVIHEAGEKNTDSVVSFAGRKDEPWQMYFIRYKQLTENAFCLGKDSDDS